MDKGKNVVDSAEGTPEVSADLTTAARSNPEVTPEMWKWYDDYKASLNGAEMPRIIAREFEDPKTKLPPGVDKDGWVTVPGRRKVPGNFGGFITCDVSLGGGRRCAQSQGKSTWQRRRVNRKLPPPRLTDVPPKSDESDESS